MAVRSGVFTKSGARQTYSAALAFASAGKDCKYAVAAVTENACFLLFLKLLSRAVQTTASSFLARAQAAISSGWGGAVASGESTNCLILSSAVPSRARRSHKASGRLVLLLRHHATLLEVPFSSSITRVRAPRRVSEILENSSFRVGPSSIQSVCHLSNSGPPSHRREPHPRIAIFICHLPVLRFSGTARGFIGGRLSPDL